MWPAEFFFSDKKSEEKEQQSLCATVNSALSEFVIQKNQKGGFMTTEVQYFHNDAHSYHYLWWLDIRDVRRLIGILWRRKWFCMNRCDVLIV